jgi:hypothetical protein
MLILKNYVSPVTCFKIFYKWPKVLQIMSNGDFEDTINDIEKESATILLKQEVYVEFLKKHKIRSDPEKAEFCILFGSLLESKIKSKIKREINNDCITYFREFPTLIIRSNPHLYLLDDPFKIDDDAEPKNNNNKEYEFLNFESLSVELLNLLETMRFESREINLGEFISKCWTYNSKNGIHNMLSDFALVEHYRDLKNDAGLDLGDCKVREFIQQRNPTAHDVVESKIENTDFVQDNLRCIFNDIIFMISKALQVRRISIDDIRSAKINHIELQSKWLKKISCDLKNNKRPKHWWKYSA